MAFDGLDRIAARGGSTGPYALQAGIAACHARAALADDTDWPKIAALYDALAQVLPSPVIELNRAVAVGMAFGPAEGLIVAEPLRSLAATKDHHLLAAVVADLLCRNGQHQASQQEFLRAAALTHNNRERTVMLERASDCSEHAEAPPTGGDSRPH